LSQNLGGKGTDFLLEVSKKMMVVSKSVTRVEKIVEGCKMALVTNPL
jgi:hypothetical protein